MAWTKVNFFQKSLDTRWRNFLFNWRQRDYLKYMRNRFQWYMYPNMRKVASFPLHVDLETTAACNLRCPMCASRHVSTEKFRQYGHMDFDLFKRLVDECAENKVFSIRLSWRGEVFVNPRFLEYVHYAKVVKEIPQVSFLTNGVRIDEQTALALIEMEVDYISVSVDGMGEMYETIRYPSKFANVYRNLGRLRGLREALGKKRPQVRITTLWPAVASNVEEYYALMSGVCDKIVYNPLKDYSVTTQDREGFDSCQFLWERLFISYDGAAHPCSNTVNEFSIGDTNTSTLKDIWHGERMTELRRMHSEKRRLEVSPCKTCSYGVDFEKRWAGRDWSDWDPMELLPEKDRCKKPQEEG